MKIKFIPKSRQFMESFPSPVPSSTLVPDWWKNGNTYTNKNATPKNGSVYATVKKCQAIFDSMTAGYYLLCPVDIYIDATKEKLDIQVPKEYIGRYHHIISSHSQEQLQGYPRPNGYHKDLIRIHPHWLTKSEKGYSALFIQPMHTKLDLQAIPGIIDIDSFISDGYLSFWVPQNFQGIIKQGTPIIQVIPIKREDCESSIYDDPNSDELIEKQNFKAKSTFINGYKKKFWNKKTYK